MIKTEIDLKIEAQASESLLRERQAVARQFRTLLAQALTNPDGLSLKRTLHALESRHAVNNVGRKRLENSIQSHRQI